jgi:hypothetical protein
MFFNPPARAFKVLVALSALLWAVNPAQARIGDTPEQMARRMLQPDLGKNFSWPKEMSEKERARQESDTPLKPHAYLLPSPGGEWHEQIFWKTAVKSHLSNENGWRIHAYFYKGRSAVELYRRVGESLNDAEVAAILARLRGTDTWRKVERRQNGDTVIGYDFELGEETAPVLRARRQGDWLVIFSPGFDAFLFERKTNWDANEALRKEEERKTQAEKAPESVEGI